MHRLQDDVIYLDYSVRPKSINDLRRHFKKSGASTVAQERFKALGHPLCKRYLESIHKTSSEFAHDGMEEKAALTDLRLFLVWLCDTNQNQNVKTKEDKDKEKEVPDQVQPDCIEAASRKASLEELSAASAAQAEINAQDVPVSPSMEHLPNPCKDAKDLLVAACKAKASPKQSHLSGWKTKAGPMLAASLFFTSCHESWSWVLSLTPS